MKKCLLVIAYSTVIGSGLVALPVASSGLRPMGVATEVLERARGGACDFRSVYACEDHPQNNCGVGVILQAGGTEEYQASNFVERWCINTTKKNNCAFGSTVIDPGCTDQGH